MRSLNFNFAISNWNAHIRYDSIHTFESEVDCEIKFGLQLVENLFQKKKIINKVLEKSAVQI